MIFILPILTIIIEIISLFWSGYFLTPEFSLYPYLTQQGFLPYREIVDQHFPILFFGPIQIPWLISRPQNLLYLFIFVICLTVFILFVLIRRKNLPLQILAYLSLITGFLLFEGRTLWLETFLAPFILLLLLLQDQDGDGASYLLGLVSSLAFLIRPTLLPFIGLYIFINYRKFSPYLLAGLLTPVALVAIYLSHFKLVENFWSAAIVFNTHYVEVAQKLPSRGMIFRIIVYSLPFLWLLYVNRKYKFLFLSLCLAFLIYPRFEPFHLAAYYPFLVVGAILSAQKKPNLSIYLLLFMLLIFSLWRLSQHRVGNYYYGDNDKLAQEISARSESSLYLMGVSDTLYIKAQRVPPQFTYVPSLPWYLDQPELQEKIISALVSSPGVLIVINQSASLDGVKIDQSSQKVLQFVKSNYQLIFQDGDNLFYKKI